MTRNRIILRLSLGLTFIFLLSCNPVGFSGQKTEGDTAVAPDSATTTTIRNVGSSPNIQCQVLLNGAQSNLTLPHTGPNPNVSAQCTPSNVTYNWQVTRNGAQVAVPGLQNQQSNPDFLSLGAGTYMIVLTATAQNFNTYTNQASPRVLTINAPPQPIPNVSCDPKLNGNQTNITYNPGSANPSVDANCQPSDAACAWTVRVGNQVVMIPGLSSCSSTADFSQSNPGTYEISLTATRGGHNSYVSPQPLRVTIPQKVYRSVVTSKTVAAQDNQIDVTLIVDDSNSMLIDNQKLAGRLNGFVQDLSGAGFDWQMCVTVTRAQQLTSNNPTLYWGASRNWAGTGSYILKSGTGNTSQIFQNTINQIGAGWAGTDDERGIKAAWWHLWNGDVRYSNASGCYRQNAGLAVVVISDEDVRSVGGDITQEFYPGEYKPLDNDDLPQTYVNYVKEVFGPAKRFAVNSIIVRPGDTTCMSQQDAQGAKSHFGTKYFELSQLTGGGVASICESDYTQNLKYFKDQIIKEMASLPLECQPVGNVNVTYSNNFNATTRVENGVLYFSPQVPVGVTIRAEYQCP